MSAQDALRDQVVVVTGGFGALGRAVAAQAMQAGARVVLVDQAAAPADLARDVLAFGGVDLADADAARAALAQAARYCGGIHALVNVAGGFQWERVEDGSVATWDHLYSTNVRTALLASQAALPHLLARGAGRIVNVGALAAAHAASGMGAYAAAKSGVARLTEAMAEEFKDRGLTVNAVLPSVIDTAANRAAMPQGEPTRWVAAQALAAVIVFLLSPAAAAINGALIPVKGRG